MFIKSIELENFRSYKEKVVIPELSNVNIFIGPNSAGKSNIIEALKCIMELIRGNLKKRFSDIVFDRNLNSQIEISLTFELAKQWRKSALERLFEKNTQIKPADVTDSPLMKTLTYSITFTKDGIINEEINSPNIKSGKLAIFKRTKNNVQTNDLTNNCENVHPNTNISSALSVRTNTGLDFHALKTVKLPEFELKLVQNIRKRIDEWQWFEPVRQVLPRMPSGEEQKITSTGSNLTKFLNSLQSNNPRLLIKLVDEVLKVMPTVEEILAPFRGSEVTLEVQENGLETPTDAGNISLGLMQIFILAFGILTKKKGSIVLIEEPELFLHARSQRRLFELIKKEAKDKQFFITTHSTIFTACNDENCTYLVTKPKGATMVMKIQSPEQLKTVKGILGHRNTDFYGNECVVFIEGDSEEVAFPIIAGSLKYDLASKGISLVNVKGSGRATKLGDYLRYLKGSETTPYVILDGNKRAKEKLVDWERDGLIEKAHWKLWDMEFEDCFSLEMIARAINEVINEQGGKLQIKHELLEKESEKGKSIVKTLKKILYENHLDLDKPALAEKIAYLLCEDMKNKDHKATPPEIEIKKIVELVESKYSKTS